MARVNTFASQPTIQALINQVNALLAPLLTNIVEQIEYTIQDEDGTGGQTFQMVIQTVASTVTQSAPFILQYVQGQNPVATMAAFNAFVAANGSLFISEPFWWPILPAGRRRTRTAPLFFFTCTDATNGALNWAGNTGGGGPPIGPAGGDLSGVYPNPNVFAGQLAVAAPAALTTLDTVALTTARAVVWEVSAWKNSTSAAYVSSLTATSDGTTPQFAEHNVVIQPAMGGTFDFTYSVAISGGNMLLQVTPSTTGWAFKIRRVVPLGP